MSTAELSSTGSGRASRTRRAYDVYECHAIAVDADLADNPSADAWVLLATGVDASTRAKAVDTVRRGRNGKYGTVLHGEFVEHEINDPRATLADELFAALSDPTEAHGYVSTLSEGSDLRMVIMAALERAEGRTK